MQSISLLVVCLSVVAGAVAGVETFVHSEVYTTLRNQGTAEVMIHFREDANLDELKFEDENQDGTVSRAEKRSQVRNFLKDFNDRSQEKARVELDAVHVDYTSYWIANAISVKNLNSKLLENLMKVAGHEIKSILPGMHGGIYRVKPTAVGNVMSKNELSGDPIQWNIKKVTADKMWEKGFNGSGVVVATLDGGVNYQHESLVDGYRGSKADGTFDHDYNWNDWAYKNAVPFDSDGHGTNVAGIMSASHGYGVAPGAKWISGKIFNYAGYSATSWTLGGCQFVMCPSPVNKPGKDENCSLGADVVSCSWGEDDATEPYLKKIIKAWEKSDMVPVFAVGNAGPKCGTSVSPSDYSGVVGVGASSQSDNIMDYSSRGPANINSSVLTMHKDPLPYDALAPAIVAPGYDIQGPSCNSNDGYNGMSGTSQAAPHVAGGAALLLSAKPSLSSQAVIKALQNGAARKSLQDPDGDDSCGGVKWNTFPNYIYGFGRLDIFDSYNTL